MISRPRPIWRPATVSSKTRLQCLTTRRIRNGPALQSTQQDAPFTWLIHQSPACESGGVMRPTCDRMSLYNLKKEGEKKATCWKAAVWDPGWKKHSGPLRVMGSCEEVTGYSSLTPGANKAASSYPALCKSPRTRRYRLHLYTECGTVGCFFHFLLFSLRQKCESARFREIAIFSLFFFSLKGKKAQKWTLEGVKRRVTPYRFLPPTLGLRFVKAYPIILWGGMARRQ